MHLQQLLEKLLTNNIFEIKKIIKLEAKTARLGILLLNTWLK